MAHHTPLKRVMLGGQRERGGREVGEGEEGGGVVSVVCVRLRSRLMPRPLPASLPQAHVENLEEQVKEQEVYHGELQEVERWLLQMSSRMVTPDPSVGGGLDEATQQLARHKVSRPLAQLAALP